MTSNWAESSLFLRALQGAPPHGGSGLTRLAVAPGYDSRCSSISARYLAYSFSTRAGMLTRVPSSIR